MRNLRRTLATAFLTAGVVLAGGSAPHADKFKVLLNFGTHKLGYTLTGPVLTDQAGDLYTSASEGGAKRGGTVVELKRKGGGHKPVTIFPFNLGGSGGSGPNGPLIIDTVGNLYGVANNLVFELSPNADKKRWTEHVLYRFCSQQNCADGNFPIGGVTYASAASGAPYDGSSQLYGTTAGGGANNGGTAFQLTNNSGSWTETVLYDFCSQGGNTCNDGSGPTSVIFDPTGTLYGTTQVGGAHTGGSGVGAGTVFQLTPGEGNTWSETVLHSFCSAQDCMDGAGPVGTLVQDADGTLFGATFAGGKKCSRNKVVGCGVVYKIIPSGATSQESVLYAFCVERRCRDGYGPQAGLALDSDGTLYGTTLFGGGNDSDVNGLGGGVLYSLSDQYTVLHHFCSLPNCADGEYPEAPPIVDQEGFAIGTTTLGGEFGNDTFGGTVFKARVRD